MEVRKGGERMEARSERKLRCWLSRWRNGPRTKKCRLPLEAGKGKGTEFPLKPPGGAQSCHHFAFSLVSLQASITMKMCCFKPLSHKYLLALKFSSMPPTLSQ